MKNRKLIILTFVLLILAAAFAVLHLSSRETVAENSVQLSADGKIHEISLSDLSLTAISGVRVNGKGEQIPVDGMGLSLTDLLEKYNVSAYSKVTVVSDDSYSAEVSADEAENANFLVEDGQLRLVVFGDSDSKRSVSNVKQIAAN